MSLPPTKAADSDRSMAESCASPVSTVSVTPGHSSEHESPIAHRNVERLRGELKVQQKSLADARRAKHYLGAAYHHKKILDIRRSLSPNGVPFAVQVEGQLRQAAILLLCQDTENMDVSLIPDPTALPKQGSQPRDIDTLALGLLYAKVGFLHMRLGSGLGLGKARDFLHTSLSTLVHLEPAPVQHMFPIAQSLADLYDFTTHDVTGAQSMVRWLVEESGQDTFQNLLIGRISEARDWCRTNGFQVDTPRFDISAMEHAILHNEPKQLVETMLVWTEQMYPAGNLPSRLLLAAAETRNLAISQLLFEHKARADAVDEEGKTVLHRCLHCRDAALERSSKKDGTKIAAFYLHKDPSLLDKQDQSGKTALYVACEVGWVEMVAFLLEIDANANLAENNAQAPLYMACERGRRPIVKCLLEKAKNLELDVRGPGGQTPLIVAVQYAASHNDGLPIVQQLLKKGADPTVADNTGKTAINYVGGIWGTTLKEALRSARQKSGGVASSSSSLNIAASTASHNLKSQRSSRPPSVASSMFAKAKVWQPRLKSGNSSLFSPSRTSLESGPVPSIFSSDMSRRTSITNASSIGLHEGAQLTGETNLMSLAEKGPASIKKDAYEPALPRSSLSDRPDDSRVPEHADTASLPTPRVQRDSASDSHDYAFDQNAESANDRPPLARAGSSFASGIDQGAPGSVNSTQSSTNSTYYDTPSDSDEDSFEPRFINLPIRSHPSGAQDRPSGSQSRQNGSFDGASSMLTPPGSDAPGGSGSSKPNQGTGHGGGSRGGKVRNATSNPDTEQKRQVLLACPFAKKDPVAHEHCHNYELREIKHVKQHLKRCHLIVVCPRCKIGYNSQDLLDQHLVGGCEIRDCPDPEGMTPKQHEILRPRTNHKVSLEEQWYFIWDTLFPGLARPPTPYKEEFVNLTEFHKKFKDFRDQQIPALADRLLHEMGSGTPMSPYDQTVFVLDRGMRELLNILQMSGVVGPNQNASNLENRAGQAGTSEAADMKPLNRHNSVERAGDQLTPDSTGVVQQCSPGSTHLSNDEYYSSMAPIDEVSTNSSGPRQGSVGHSQEPEPFMQPNPIQTLHMPHGHPLQQAPLDHPYNGPMYGAQGPGTDYDFTAIASWNDQMMDGYHDPILSPHHFTMDQGSIEQMLQHVESDAMDMDIMPGRHQLSQAQTPSYFPMQQAPGQPQVPMAPPYMGAGQPAVPFAQMAHHVEEQSTSPHSAHPSSQGPFQNWYTQ